MAYQFIISAGATEDAHKCAKQDPYAAAKLAAVLREIMADNIFAEELVDDRDQQDPIESVEPLVSLQAVRINAYRVKIVDVFAWRLITAVDNRTKRVGLLAVMHRGQDYESDSDLWSRIEREYDDNSFPRY